MKYLKLIIFISVANQIYGVRIQQSTPLGSSIVPFTTAFGDLVTGEKIDSFDMMFQYNIPTDLCSSTTSGTGSIASTPPFAVLTSSSDGTGTAQVESTKRLRYVPAHEGYLFFTAIYTTGIANTSQYVGLIDDNDGWAIGYNGTAFSVFWKRNGSDVSGYPLASTSFNLDALDGTGPSKITLDPTKLNVYRISFGWLGAAPIVFEVLRNDGVWFPFHIIKYCNTEADTSTRSSVLPVRAYASASGAAGNVILKTPSWSCGVIGKNYTKSRSYQFYPGGQSLASGSNKYAFTLKSNANYPIGSAITNKLDVHLHYIGVANRSNTDVTFKLIKNATLTGTSYIDIDSTNSCMQYSTAGSYTSGGTVVFVMPLAQKGQELLLLDDQLVLIEIDPGDTLTLVADTGAAADINASIYWEEHY